MAPAPREVLRFIGRSSKRVAVSVVGGALVLGGLAMLVLPGPGILVVALGFAVLGTEYVWAATALEHTKRAADKAGEIAMNGARAAGRGAVVAARAARRSARRSRHR